MVPHVKPSARLEAGRRGEEGLTGGCVVQNLACYSITFRFLQACKYDGANQQSLNDGEAATHLLEGQRRERRKFGPPQILRIGIDPTFTHTAIRAVKRRTGDTERRRETHTQHIIEVLQIEFGEQCSAQGCGGANACARAKQTQKKTQTTHTQHLNSTT
jgi:hypothetical protein